VPSAATSLRPGHYGTGLIEHVGASTGKGVTAQVSATELKNPPAAETTLIVEVDDAPGLRAAGVNAETESEKSESNVAPTCWAELVVTLQVPAPERARLQPTKGEPGGGVAVSVTIVPRTKNAEHVLEQFTPWPSR
jgi:hypothetical protein